MISQPITAATMEISPVVGGSNALLWQAFDAIYCITLRSRTDRRQTAQREFDRVGLGERIQFITVDRHQTNSEQGIFESHMMCLRAGLAADANRILIFEDDILFHRFDPAILARVIQFMNADSGWQILFLGCFVKSSKTTANPSVLEMRYRCSAHAYAINRPFAEQLVNQQWNGIAFDDLLTTINGGVYHTCYPAMVSQSASPTDNDQILWVDRVRRVLGGTQRLQRWNEFNNHNFRKLVMIHAAILAIVICATLHWMRR